MYFLDRIPLWLVSILLEDNTIDFTGGAADLHKVEKEESIGDPSKMGIIIFTYNPREMWKLIN